MIPALSLTLATAAARAAEVWSGYQSARKPEGWEMMCRALRAIAEMATDAPLHSAEVALLGWEGVLVWPWATGALAEAYIPVANAARAIVQEFGHD